MIRHSLESKIAKRQRQNRNRIVLLLNIPESVTTDNVRELFAQAGLRCTIPDVNHNETPVKFSTNGHVTKALVILNQLHWLDRDRTPVQAIQYEDKDDPAFTGRVDRNGLPPVNTRHLLFDNDYRNNNNRDGGDVAFKGRV